MPATHAMDAAELIAKLPTLSAPVTRDAEDAVLDAIALSACADGVTNDELVVLLRMARELPSLKGRPPAEVDERVRASFERLAADGLEARLKQLGNTSFDDGTRRRMFAAAAVVQYADGHVTNEENEFLLDLADVLGLDETRVRDVVEEIERELGARR